MGAEGARILTLDDEKHGSGEAAASGSNELAQVANTPQSRRVGKKGDAVLDQSGGLRLQKALAPRPGEKEIDAALTEKLLSLDFRIGAQRLNKPGFEGLTDETVRQASVGADPAAAGANKDEVIGGAPAAAGAEGKQGRGARRQKLQDAPRVRQMGKDGGAIHLNLNEEAIETPANPARDETFREEHIGRYSARVSAQAGSLAPGTES